VLFICVSACPSLKIVKELTDFDQTWRGVVKNIFWTMFRNVKTNQRISKGHQEQLYKKSLHLFLDNRDFANCDFKFQQVFQLYTVHQVWCSILCLRFLFA
jgi:hypothetical protein